MKIQQAGLTLKAEKCHLLHRKLKYLGHIVSQQGMECDPDMTSTGLANTTEHQGATNFSRIRKLS